MGKDIKMGGGEGLYNSGFWIGMDRIWIDSSHLKFTSHPIFEPGLIYWLQGF